MLVSNKNFNQFKVHTQYSICEGAIKIDELADYCKSKKIKAIGLADSYNLCGALEFSEKISKVGTHPIIGTQININALDIIGKVSLYATTEEGYKNLTKLSSSSYLKNNASTDPSCSLKDLMDNNEGLILFFFKMKFSSLLCNPFVANFDSSSSGDPLSLLAIEGRIGLDFFGLKLNLK